MKQGDIVLLAFPFTDLTSVKVRPGLVLSSESFNKRSEDLVFALITSNTSRIQAEDIILEPSNPDFPKSGLKRASALRIGRLHTLSKRLARRRLGEATPRLMGQIQAKLRQIFDLS